MRKCLANYNNSKTKLRSNFFTPKICKRGLSITEIAAGDENSRMYSVVNNLNLAEYPSIPSYTINELYIQRSMESFFSVLKADSLYILVEKAIAKNSRVEFRGQGHITSFVTNQNREVDKDLTVSLRPGAPVKVKIGDEYGPIKLTYSYAYLNKDNTTEESIRVRHVQFAPLEFELMNVLNEAMSKTQVERFLIELPLHTLNTKLKDHITQTKDLKETLLSKWFIILDGHVGGKPFKSLNCVTGFYGRFFLRSTTTNPSPQMAAWSYLAHSFGTTYRDKFISGTKLRAPGVERTYDDKPEQITKEELSSLQMNQ
ncbi:MAG: hypothetical protein K2X50_08805 [Gammaproteobacteria bacterium]|nr:hypothetical protein [Gammaproteobacteria bacterium]